MSGIENFKKHSLGKRAFFLFFSRRLRSILLFFAITAFAWYAERWFPASDQIWTNYAVLLLLILSITYLVLILFRTYMEYRFYTYTFTEEAFIMTRGYIVRDEIAALYHQIQNVNVRRSPLDRLVGVSQIIIFMSGADRDSRHNPIVLPAVSKHKAALVQKELLARARREHMIAPV